MPIPYFFTGEDVEMPSGLSLSLEKASQMERVPLHGHDFIEIAFVASGSARHRHIDRTGKLRTDCLIQGDVFSVLTGEKHAFEQCSNMVLFNIFLTNDFLREYATLQELPGWKHLFGERTDIPDTVMHLPAVLCRWAAQNLDRAAIERKRRLAGFSAMMTAEVVEFLIHAMRAFEINRVELPEESHDILQSVAMMEAHPEKDFTLELLATTVHMSIPSYTKKFRAAIGTSPMEYLQKLRLFQARHYLSASDLSISEVANVSGFCSASYLIKIFKRELGQTPLQYRAEYKGLAMK